jgi:hypothetical protein
VKQSCEEASRPSRNRPDLIFFTPLSRDDGTYEVLAPRKALRRALASSSLTTIATIRLSIPNAKFVPLESVNHVLLSDESAFAQFIGGVKEFLANEN